MNLTKENLTIHSKNYKMLCPFVIDFIGKNTQNEGKNNKKKLIQKNKQKKIKYSLLKQYGILIELIFPGILNLKKLF